MCAKAFVSIHGITRARLRRIQLILVSTGSAPRDLRGLHENHYRQTPPEIVKVIEGHIKSLRRHQSHYSLRDNPHRFYLHEDLKCVADVHREFLHLYQINVSYQVYSAVFRTFNLGFSMPRSDTCNICDGFIHQIVGAESEEERNRLVVEKRQHLSIAAEFRSLKLKYTELARKHKLTLLTFDYMQNLPVPNLQTSIVFYATQLWTYVFGIHNAGNKKATMYVYDEVNGHKGGNNVASLLFRYFRQLPYKPLILMCDNCPGQNKNRILVRFLYAAVHIWRIVPKIRVIFPIRGHTYLPNDQDFSVVSRNKKSIAAETPQQWIAAIKQSKKKPPKFHVEKIHQEQFFDMFGSLKKFFLATPRPGMKLKSVRMIDIDQKFADVKVRFTYSGLWHNVTVRNNRPLDSEVHLQPLYTENILLKQRKLDDLRKLFQYTRQEKSRKYYENLWEKHESHSEEDGDEAFVEVDNDDNSSEEEGEDE